MLDAAVLNLDKQVKNQVDPRKTDTHKSSVKTTAHKGPIVSKISRA